MPEPPIVELTNKFRADLLRKERAAAVRLVNAYGDIYKTLLPQIDALVNELAANPDMKLWKKLKLKRLQTLRDQVEVEVGKFGNVLEAEVNASAREAIMAAGQHARLSTQASLPGMAELDTQIMATWSRLPAESVETLLGFLAPDSPLRKRMDKLGPAVADSLQEAMQRGLALGLNPRDIARQAIGDGLQWGLQTARTVQLNTYREATRANYIANSHVVKGWTWTANKDSLTCLSCLAMDGTEHPLSEKLEDHNSGRCVPRPITVTYRDLGLPIDELPDTRESAQAWFERQPESVQKQMMGKGKFAAWKEGKFDFADLSQRKKDAVWGHIRTETPLKDLVEGG